MILMTLQHFQIFRKESQSDSVLHHSHIGSTAYIPASSMDYYPKHVICDPVGPMKMKGRPKIATRIRSGIELSKENRQKR